MKNLIYIIGFIILLPPAIYSQEENFSYPIGDSLIQHGWVHSGPILMEYPRIIVTSPGLSFFDYAGSGIGRAALLDSIGIEVLWKIFEIPGYETGSVYVSMMINVKYVSAAESYFTGISPVGSAGARGVVFIKDSSGSVAIGLSKNVTSPIYTPARYSLNTTYLIVIKYTFIPGSSNDPVSLFVFENSIPLTEPVPTLSYPPVGFDLSNAGSVTIIQNVNGLSRVVIDGIYFRDSWDQQVLPVEISSFNANVNERDVRLSWTTASEENNSGFEIERRDARGETQDVWNKRGFVSGHGTVLTPVNYTFEDRNLTTGNYKYRLKQIDFNGNFDYHELQNEVEIGTPDKFYLSQNYPNPFNPTTNLEFGISELGFVSLKIYNTSGKEVATLVNEVKTAGYYTVEFNGSNLSSGVYYYRIESGEFSQVRKMVILK